MSTTPINRRTIDSDTRGMTWDFQQAAEALNPSIITASKNDIIHSSPVIIGDISGISGTEVIDHHGVKIKGARSWRAGIPESLYFTANIANVVMHDLLELAGSEYFFNCQIGIITQRKLTEFNTASRKRFTHWHEHNRDGSDVDISYQFYDNLPTELKSPEGEIVSSEKNQMIRMGAGITHRSQTNLSNKAIMRTWGAILVYGREKPLKNGMPANIALNPINDKNTPYKQAEHLNQASITTTKPYIPLFK